MYVLSVLEDEVALHPSEFGINAHIPAIRKMIEAKYVDRVIPDVGLVIALYDVLKVRDAYIFPGDLKDSQGDAACTVVFRVIVFRPKIGELLVGRVLASTPMGLQVTLGFFQDVSIPIAHLRKPCHYDDRSKSWLWNYESEPGAIPVPYPYLRDELICLRVKSVQFLDSLDESLSAARRAQALSKDEAGSKIPAGQFAHDVQTEHPPMLVVGSVEDDGMGLKSWWI